MSENGSFDQRAGEKSSRTTCSLKRVNVFWDWARLTTLGAVRLAVFGSQRLAKFFWAIVFFCSLAMALFMFVEVVQKYFWQQPTTVVEVGVRSLRFPAVTICNVNALKKNAAAKVPAVATLLGAYQAAFGTLGNSSSGQVTYRRRRALRTDHLPVSQDRAEELAADRPLKRFKRIPDEERTAVRFNVSTPKTACGPQTAVEASFLFEGRCYWYSSLAYNNWTVAFDECSKMGGYLVHITSERVMGALIWGIQSIATAISEVFVGARFDSGTCSFSSAHWYITKDTPDPSAPSLLNSYWANTNSTRMEDAHCRDYFCLWRGSSGTSWKFCYDDIVQTGRAICDIAQANPQVPCGAGNLFGSGEEGPCYDAIAKAPPVTLNPCIGGIILAGDWDGDGNCDLVCANDTATLVSRRFFFGAPKAGFIWSNADLASPIDAECPRTDLYYLDINGDKRTDMMCHSASNGSTFMKLNNGISSGSIVWNPKSSPVTFCPDGIVKWGDVNCDGKADLVCNANVQRIALNYGNNLYPFELIESCRTCAGNTICYWSNSAQRCYFVNLGARGSWPDAVNYCIQHPLIAGVSWSRLATFDTQAIWNEVNGQSSIQRPYWIGLKSQCGRQRTGMFWMHNTTVGARLLAAFPTTVNDVELGGCGAAQNDGMVHMKDCIELIPPLCEAGMLPAPSAENSSAEAACNSIKEPCNNFRQRSESVCSQYHSLIPSGMCSDNYATGDFDSDGLCDVWCQSANADPSLVRDLVYYGAPGSTLQPGQPGVDMPTWWPFCIGNIVFAADFNNDGLDDLVCHKTDTGEISILINQGSTIQGSCGWMNWSNAYYASSGYCSASDGGFLVVGDGNCDGKVDLGCKMSNGTFCSTVYQTGSLQFDLASALPCISTTTTTSTSTTTTTSASTITTPVTCTPSCQNGGICELLSNAQFVCYCTQGWEGATCDQSVDDCASNPCASGSICQDATDAYMCLCPPGFTGIDCQTDINECANQPCPGTAQCMQYVNGYTCVNQTEIIAMSQALASSAADSINPMNQLTLQSQVQDAIAYATADVSNEDLAEGGHQARDMVVQCSYDQQPCSWRNMLPTFDATFGNCYTFNWNTDSAEYANRPGSQFGLDLTLRAETADYMPFQSSEGFKMVLHTQEQSPFPDMGITLPLGSDIQYGLRYVESTRLPPPFGDCIAENNVNVTNMNYYNGSYSIEGCGRSCRQDYIISRCGCGDPKAPLPAKSTIRYCTFDQRTCVNSASDSFSTDMKTICAHCLPPCRIIGFDVAETRAKWLANNFKLFECGKSKQSNCTAEFSADRTKVKVYFQRLMFLSISETTQYEPSQLLSDVGGSFGLWLGSSMLSIAELLLLLVGVAIAKSI